RRRHTRFSRDWSSDVCSSDLILASYDEVTAELCQILAAAALDAVSERGHACAAVTTQRQPRAFCKAEVTTMAGIAPLGLLQISEIGRASCRERVALAVVSGRV